MLLGKVTCSSIHRTSAGEVVYESCHCGAHRVRVLDSLIEQVHGGRDRPEGLDPEVDLVVGDVRDESALRRSLAGVDKVVHLAAEAGVGQSMYAVDRYVSVNDHGTAVLFQQLIERPVKRVVVASSMSIYGEGLYRDADAYAEQLTADGSIASQVAALEAEFDGHRLVEHDGKFTMPRAEEAAEG